MAISANEQMVLQKREDWNDMMEAWLENPQQAVNHLAFGMDLNTRRQARQESGKSQVSKWI